MSTLRCLCLGILAFVGLQSRGVGQELRITVDWINFDCSSEPELFEKYEGVFKSGVVTKASSEAQMAFVEHLRQFVPVQISVRSVHRIEVGKWFQGHTEINHHRMSLRVLAQPPEGGAYPLEVEQNAEVTASSSSLFSGIGGYSRRIPMTPGVTYVGTRSSSKPRKHITLLLTTLSESKVAAVNEGSK